MSGASRRSACQKRVFMSRSGSVSSIKNMNSTELFRRRSLVALCFVSLAYAGIVGRLFFMQGLHGKQTRKEALKARRVKMELKAHRGSILSSDGTPLAVSKYRGKLGFDPSIFATPLQDPAKNALREQQIVESTTRIAAIIGETPSAVEEAVSAARLRYAYLQRTLSKKQFDKINTRFALIKDDLTLPVASAVRSALILTRADQKLGFKHGVIGFGINDGTYRSYDQNEAGIQVIGYVDKDESPTSLHGLERDENHALAQKSGRVEAERDRLGRIIPGTETVFVAPRNGMDIHTTIDTQIQAVASEQAKLIIQKYRPAGVSIVVMDPYTGDIWTMVSYPSISPTELRQMQTKKEANANLGSLLRERCISEKYEPGSTLKTLTIGLALEKRFVKRDSYFFCNGSLAIGKHPIHDSHPGAHGSLSLDAVLAKSCNICAAQIGLSMPAWELTKGMRELGLLEKPGTQLSSEQGGSLSTDADRRRGRTTESRDNLARISFGQAITTTPINLTRAYCAIANGGWLLKPRLISSYSQDDKTVRNVDKATPRRVFSKETCLELTKMLTGVVSVGTGKDASVPGFTVAGKTGTTQKLKERKNIGSFIGFLPANKPRAVVLVVVDEPNGEIMGGMVAAPAFRAIGAAIMSQKNVPQDDPELKQFFQAHPLERPIKPVL